jgi:hypothetical protein
MAKHRDFTQNPTAGVLSAMASISLTMPLKQSAPPQVPN